MPNKHGNQGHGNAGHGGGMGHGGGSIQEDQAGEIGQHRDTTPAAGDDVRGRRDSSPGHMKKAGGDRSARDYAPGRTATTDRDPGMSDVAPDEVGEDRD